MRYVLLVHLEDNGVDASRDFHGAIEEAANAFRKANGVVHETVYCIGDVDLVTILEAQDVELVTAFALALKSVTALRTVVLQGYTPSEMQSIAGKAGLIRDGYIRGGSGGAR